MNDLVKYSEKTFENIKHINEYGEEFWYARELQLALEYSEWRNFNNTIEKAKTACATSGFDVQDHFVDVNKMVEIGSGAERKIDDIVLSRYACYLIVMNGDPKKEVIAIGQTYFAVKTRQQEMIDDFDGLTEEQRRLAIRNEMIKHNKLLADAANKAGVVEPLEYAIFQNYGYKGLYGGMDMKAIHKHKGLKKVRKFWTTWAVRSLQQICSVPRRPKKSSVVKTFKERKMPTEHTMKLVQRCVRLSRNLAVQCRKICLPQTRASSRLNGRWKRKSWRTERNDG